MTLDSLAQDCLDGIEAHIRQLSWNDALVSDVINGNRCRSFYVRDGGMFRVTIERVPPREVTAPLRSVKARR